MTGTGDREIMVFLVVLLAALILVRVVALG